MARSLFGTDGVRGRANTAPMTAEIAMRIGMAAGQVFHRGAHRNRLFELFPYGYVQQACKIAGMIRPRAWSTG